MLQRKAYALHRDGFELLNLRYLQHTNDVRLATLSTYLSN